MKNQEKNRKLKIRTSFLLISFLLFFTISTSIQVNAAYPQGKFWHAMAYDSINDVIVVYGGSPQSAYAYWGFETWTYDYNNNEWTKMNPSEHPYGGVSSQLVYDSESEKMVQFGGHNKEDYSSNETWIYDYIPNTWTPAAPNNVPRLRAGHTMAYDSESDVVIMFGGGLEPDYNPYGGRIVYNDTWAYDLNTDTWTNMTPAVSPLGRIAAEMAYDSESDRVIMFGGHHSPDKSAFLDPTGQVYQTGTWAYDFNSNTWENVTDELANPNPRVGHAMAYDSESDAVILFGGHTHLNTAGMQDETWMYDYNEKMWTHLSTTEGLERSDHEMAYDSESDLIILFGGFVAASAHDYLAETWVYDYNTETWTLMEIPTPPTTTNFYILGLIVSIAAISILKIRRRK
ncbi:MAG: hypothetical protein KAU62_03210 [Candidatus Heimdallarchaeota archaeon]|nr:hypothetical protein [Candidatus Heimdallarchaeota archaeon]MCG3255072.1 hypothetical protein [Candidatus Heimdallarchaeota archaeon]MCK4610146.1 hypothetical protein [Candidatus Heimdallarchaeota archaeon]